MTSDTSDSPAASAGNRTLVVDLAAVDLAARLIDRRALERWNPHRGQMALLDYVIWHSQDFRQGVALWQVRDEEFWVPGHFPGRPLLPGVLQVEAGAQLSVFLYNARRPEPKLCAFTRIKDCAFRGQVVPGDDLYLLARELKANERRFNSLVQGVVKGKVVFEAEIAGIAI